MAKTKYGQYFHQLSFTNDGPGAFRQGAHLSPQQLGQDIHIRYGTYWTAGKINDEEYFPHTHDYDQVLFFLGADCNELSELGAEIEVVLGEDKERARHIVTSSSAVFIPKGFAHGPVTINSMDKRFFHIEISLAPEMKSIKVTSDKRTLGEIPYAKWFSKNSKHIHELTFARKSAWHYGPLNRDDSGGSISGYNASTFNYGGMWESIRRAPYRFGPIPDKPHVHKYNEFLCFLGADTSDLSKLGAEVELCMGKEMERHVITSPTIVFEPKGLPHCPVRVTKMDKPFIFSLIYPQGTDHPH